MIFGRGTVWRETGWSKPIHPRPGPARVAVLAHNGRRVLINRVLECCEYANAHCLVGATITCLGDTEPCAVIERFDWPTLVKSNALIPTGGPPGIALDEAMLLVS